MATTKVQKTTSERVDSDGETYETTQYRVGIPKGTAEYHQLEQGTPVYWGRGSSAHKMELELDTDRDGSAVTTVQVSTFDVTSADDSTREATQYRITIPKNVATSHGLEKGDEFFWGRGSSKNKIELEIIEGGDSGADR